MSAPPRRRPTPALVLALAAAALPSAALGHRLDEYLQATIVDVAPDDIRLRMNLTPGVEVADAILPLIDRDHDGAVSADEASAYAELLRRDLTLRCDGRELGLTVAGSSFPPPADLRDGWGIIRVEFAAAPGALAAGPHRLTLDNRHLAPLSAYLFNAARPAARSIEITGQRRNDTQSAGEIGFTFRPPAGARRTALTVGALLAALLVAGAVVWRARGGPRPAARSAGAAP